jgi:bifunctional non-homologous end joining protein LigD
VKTGASRLPAFVPPMAARLTDRLPEDGRWIYEVKFDGYRAQLRKNLDEVRIRSRNDKDLTGTYPDIRAAATRLQARTALVDGEVVAVDETGHPSFQALQHRGSHQGHRVVFYAFDLLHLNGKDLTRRPLEERRAALPRVLDGSGILLSESLQGTVAELIEAIRGLRLEGIVAKRKDSLYDAGQRSDAWLKLKLDQQQELVIGGYRPGPQGIDALLVGYHEGRALRFAGKVRAGFTPHLRRELAAALRRHHAETCPFVDLPNSKTSHWGGGVTAEQMREMQWLKPVLVAQIRFVEWTADGHLRHAAYLGLRRDKKAKDVRRE